MSLERFQRVKQILAAALALPESEREAYLRAETGDDTALGDEVRSLMVFDDETAAARAAVEIDDGEARPGSEIDGFRLLSVLGEGGMGVVYLAEQIEPIRRRVALKIIKIGMDSHEVISRFEAERQALALMDHPNIARVIEAGATPGGRPYFVMEYIEGVPLTEYCRANRLTLEDRLRLFVQVCRAVDHAHRRGVIHRDLKPGNVLISDETEGPVAKVIDFGVAKATDQRLTENTVCTQLGVLIGTPEYMSPEQATLEQVDIDVRCDIYSLGVILYELLTGELPINRETLLESGWGRIQELLREYEPTQPSTRLGETRTGRRTAGPSEGERPTWTRRIRGDLDWVTMRALEKDRERRYTSSAQLADEIERFLADQPVEAGPPSRRYRMRKFVRRHRTAVTAAAVILAVLLFGVTGTTIGMIRAERAEARARAAARASEAGRLYEMAQNAELPSHSLALMNAALHLVDRPEYRLEIERLLLAEPPMHRLPRAVDSHNPVFADFSHDGERLAISWSRNGSLQLYSLTGGDPVLLEGHQQSVTPVHFLPDDSALVSAALDSTVRLWSMPGGELARTWRFDGLPMLYAGEDVFPATVLVLHDGTPRVAYRCESADADFELLGETGPVVPVARKTPFPAVDPAGGLMVLVGRGEVGVYDLRSPSAFPVRILGRHEGLPVHAAFAPDGSEVMTYDADGRILCWDPQGGHVGPLRELHSGELPDRSRYSADSRWIVATSSSGLYLWDRRLPADALPFVLRGSTGWSFDTAFHPMLPWLVSLHTGATPAVWSLAGPRPIRLSVWPDDGVVCGFTPDGAWLVAASEGSGSIRAWPLDGDRIGESRVLATFPNHRYSYISFDDAGEHCYLSVCNSPLGTGSLIRIRIADGATEVRTGGTCTWMVDRTGRRAACTGDDGIGFARARLYDVETDRWIELQGSLEDTRWICGFAADDRLLTFGDASLGLWTPDGLHFERLAGRPDEALLSGDRRSLVLRTLSGEWLRGPADGSAPLRPVRGPRESGWYDLACDRTARRVAFGSQAGDAEVVDFETGESYAYPLRADSSTYPAFDPQGRWLAWGADGVITLVPLPEGSSRLDWERGRYLEWLDRLSNLRIEMDPERPRGYRVVGRGIPEWSRPPRY